MKQARNDSSLGSWTEVKSKKEVLLEAKRDKKEKPLCHIDGRMSSQKMRSWNPKFRSIKVESYSEVTL